MCITLTHRHTNFIGFRLYCWNCRWFLILFLCYMGHPYSLYTLFPSSVDVTHDSSQEPGSPCGKSILFCKSTTLITAVPSHDMNQGSIITILLSTKMITTSYRLSLHCLHDHSDKPCRWGTNVIMIFVWLFTVTKLDVFQFVLGFNFTPPQKIFIIR